MSRFEQDKLDNAICFFAKRHRERTGKPLYQTYLYKYLAFTDFYTLLETGAPAFQIAFEAWDMGPVPPEIYEKRYKLKTSIYSFKPDLDTGIENAVIIESYGSPDLEFFSEFEIRTMEKLINEYAKDYATTSAISEKSHELIRSWQQAYSRGKKTPMDPSENFDGTNDHHALSRDSYIMRRAMK